MTATATATTTTTTTTDITQQHSSTAHRPPSFQRPTQLLQPNSRVVSAQTMATSPDQPGALLLFWFLFTHQARCTEAKGSRDFFAFEQINSSFLDYLPLMNKSSSCCGKQPTLIPISFIFPIILCRRPLCPVLDVRRYVALCWNSRLSSFFQKR